MTTNLPGIIAGKYECTAIIGRGGMGTVYKAVHQTLGRTVAIKMLSEELASDIEFRARFQQEAEVVAHMNHPNIVAVYDIEPHNHTYCIIMEFLDGESLQAKIDRMRMLPEHQTVEYGAQLATALDYAHAEGVIHRDIKPDNVIVTHEGVAKLTDFGIARFLESKFKTQTGVSMGTPKFMSPEQVTGKNVDGQSDLYSLGICLYYCLAGQTPFDGDNPIAVATKHLYEEPPPPSQFNQAISPAVEKVILRSLEKNKEIRYKTGGEFARALTESLGQRTPIRLSGPGLPAASSDPTRRIQSGPPEDSSPFAPATTAVLTPPGGMPSPGSLPSAPIPAQATPAGSSRDDARERSASTSGTGAFRALSDSSAVIGAVVNHGARIAETTWVRKWWPAMAAVSVIAAALIFATATNRFDALDATPELPPSSNGTAPGDPGPAAEYDAVMAEVGQLRTEGKLLAAREKLATFAQRRPGFRSAIVAADLDLITAALPLPEGTELLAERRDRKGRDYNRDRTTYHLAKAYFEAARDLYRGMSKSYTAGDTFIQLLDRSLPSVVAQHPPDAAEKAASLYQQAIDMARNGSASTTAAETLLVEATGLAPQNFEYWMALGDIYLNASLTDDARVIYGYVKTHSAPGDDAARRAGLALRQLE